MRESRGNARPFRRCFAAGGLFLVCACGGTVVQRGGSGSGGDSGASGSDGFAGGTSAGGFSGSLGGRTGRGGSGGKVGGSGGTVGGPGGMVGSGAAGIGDCLPPYTLCGSSCVDLQSSSSSCGYCLNGCGVGTSCVAGYCQVTPQTCPSNETYCANFAECLDLNTNAFACGSCSTPCVNGERCNGGKCLTGTCLSSTATYCKSSGRCIELSTDYANCGACDNQCTGGTNCVNGQCVPQDCGGSTYCQNYGCTDTTTDVSNCGGCGISCTQGSTFDYSAYGCNAGTCGCMPTANTCGKGCATNFWYCPPDGFSGVAADYCAQTARNSYERCACKGCLAEVQACFGSPSCVNAMDCALSNPCTSCQPVFYSCSDQNGAVDPLADKLVACLNSQCAAP